MTICQGDLDKLLEVNADHAAAIAAAEKLVRKRNALVLQLTNKGATRADIATALGISRGRVQQMVDTARGD